MSIFVQFLLDNIKLQLFFETAKYYNKKSIKKENSMQKGNSLVCIMLAAAICCGLSKTIFLAQCTPATTEAGRAESPK
jgi:hypothetical protein